MGPSAYAGDAGIMSGRTPLQQGLATTCKDHVTDGTTGGARRNGVWRMSPYELGRRDNALRDDPRGRSDGGNDPAGQRGSGHSAAAVTRTYPDSGLGLNRLASGGEGA